MESEKREQKIGREWLDGFLEKKLPGTLKNLREKRPVAVTDFVKLVQLEWQANPVKPQKSAILWVDFDDQDERPA